MWTDLLSDSDLRKDLVTSSLTAVAIILSWLSLRHAQKAVIFSRKPVLIFQFDGDHGWILRNVGMGPALNLIVAQKSDAGSWCDLVRAPPLSKDGEFALFWLSVDVVEIGVTYTDFEGAGYLSRCRDDLSEVKKSRLFSQGATSKLPIDRHWERRQ